VESAKAGKIEAAIWNSGFTQAFPLFYCTSFAFSIQRRLRCRGVFLIISKQSLMRLMAHPVTHENIGFYWERRRLAGFAFRLNAAAIPNPSRRDAGAPSVIFEAASNAPGRTHAH
jgi:hypothetical protein